MKRESRTQLGLLNEYIARWKAQPKMSKALVCQEIVETFFAKGFDSILHCEGITFTKTHDPFNDMRVNSQKIGRWLGDDDSQPCNRQRLFEMEPVIVAAMPEDLRIDYLNEKYQYNSLLITTQEEANASIDYHKMAHSLTKENSEAQMSVIDLGHQPTLNQAKAAHKELRDSVATSTASMKRLEEDFPQLLSASH